MKILPESWVTDRLWVRDASMEDVPELRNVFNACSYVGEWDTSFYEETEEAFIKLVSKSLGLNHTAKDIFKMQSVLLRGSKRIIGYFHLFHDAPIPHRVWISMFVVHPHFQQNRYGSELAYGIWDQFRQMGEYEAIWLRVSLKNWPALRFWVDMGWRTIVHYEGDTVMSEDTTAAVVLERKLPVPTQQQEELSTPVMAYSATSS
jgi:ribosomal protein S18 acetylase RimI-like enzyme